jgi:hypothetical protein
MKRYFAPEIANCPGCNGVMDIDIYNVSLVFQVAEIGATPTVLRSLGSRNISSITSHRARFFDASVSVSSGRQKQSVKFLSVILASIGFSKTRSNQKDTSKSLVDYWHSFK